MLASGTTAIAGFAVLVPRDIRMLRDFGAVTVVDLTVSLLGVLVVLPAVLVLAERRAARAPARLPARLGAGSGRCSRDERRAPGVTGRWGSADDGEADKPSRLSDPEAAPEQKSSDQQAYQPRGSPVNDRAVHVVRGGRGDHPADQSCSSTRCGTDGPGSEGLVVGEPDPAVRRAAGARR